LHADQLGTGPFSLHHSLSMHSFSTFRLALLLAAACLAIPVQAEAILGRSGSRFTIDGKQTFLFGISYYGGLGASDDFVRKDLNDIQSYGFNWLRIWATWAAFDTNLSAVNPETGEPREPFFTRLKSLVTECDRRGLIVDITLGKGDGPGPDRLDSYEKHLRVVKALVSRLKNHRNWYLDLSNERNIRDKRFTSIDDLRALRRVLKQLDTNRLVTASSGTDIPAGELREYLVEAQIDFIAPHRPRGPESPGKTAAVTRELLAAMTALGLVVPIHYQEPFRRGYTDWQPRAEDFATDLLAAKNSGAAGWCFHNGSQRGAADGKPRRSFDLREKRLFDQLDPEERKALELMRNLLGRQTRVP